MENKASEKVSLFQMACFSNKPLMSFMPHFTMLAAVSDKEEQLTSVARIFMRNLSKRCMQVVKSDEDDDKIDHNHRVADHSSGDDAMRRIKCVREARKSW